MTDYLPADIWREILLKLPVKSLIRFTTVCKSWKSLVVSPDFIYAHLSLSKNHSSLRSFHEHYDDDDYLPLEFTETGCKGSSQIDAYSNPKIPFKFKHYVIVACCDGIVCLTQFLTLLSCQPFVVCLWNPSVRNHVFLPPTITTPKVPYKVLLGFGVANHIYKVICLVYCLNPDRNGFVVPQQAEIFSLGTERWRSVSGFDMKFQVHSFTRRQILLKGIIHWFGYEQIDDGSYRSCILAFDIGNEVFGKVMLPDVLALVRESETSLLPYKIGGLLALVKSSKIIVDDDAHDVWVMKDYGVKASWTKLYSINFSKERKNGYLFQIIGFKNGETLLSNHAADFGLADLFSYNLETKQVKDFGIFGTWKLLFIDDYVESLLLLKGSNVPAAVGCWI